MKYSDVIPVNPSTKSWGELNHPSSVVYTAVLPSDEAQTPQGISLCEPAVKKPSIPWLLRVFMFLVKGPER